MNEAQERIDKNMLDTIVAQLDEIERREDIRILHAVESGSRAWGFESPDSDYDVRFIYVCRREDYLKLEKTRDVIEWQLDALLDINGWDIKKALRLLRNSNPTFFEWCNSPIVYKTTPTWSVISQEIGNYFLRRTGLHHYLNMATGNNRKYLQGETVKLKKYFYVLRPLLACKWIVDKNCPPPMLFSDLVEAELEPEMRSVVDDLLLRKAATSEIGESKRIDVLTAYIDTTVAGLQEAINELPPDSKASWERLNQLFMEAIG